MVVLSGAGAGRRRWGGRALAGSVASAIGLPPGDQLVQFQRGHAGQFGDRWRVVGLLVVGVGAFGGSGGLFEVLLIFRTVDLLRSIPESEGIRVAES